MELTQSKFDWNKINGTWQTGDHFCGCFIMLFFDVIVVVAVAVAVAVAVVIAVLVGES